ncbi:MAG TPA: hypothetical protein VFI09_08200 [Solirubrobacterales bacterium]|nr:hypothetical protein [Solirubrobacterales bacterium]
MIGAALAIVLPVAAGGAPGWLTLLLGAYGAAVSTLLAFSQMLRDRPGVKLRLTPTNVEYPEEDEEYGGVTRDFWEVRVVNHRKRPITIRRGGMLGDRGQHLSVRIVDPYAIVDSRPLRIEPFPCRLIDGTSFSFFLELDNLRDRERAGAYVVDDLDNTYRIHSPTFSPRRRFGEWKARRRFERAIGGKATFIQEWRPWRWRWRWW